MFPLGNRSREVTEACKRHGGFYFGSIGGPAAGCEDQRIISRSPWRSGTTSIPAPR